MKRKILIITIVMLLLSTLLVACSGDKEIVGIQLVKEGFPYEVTVGTTPDYSNVKANIQYNDETTKEVTGADLTFSTIDTSKTGTQELTVTYQGFSITVTVTVKAAQVTLSKIDIISSSVADEVLVGNTHDTTGIQVLATYSDGTTKTLTAADVTVTGIDTATAGEKTLTVTYGDKTATMTVTVAGITGIRAEGVPTTVEEGLELDLTNLKVYAVYSNGDEVLLEASAYTTAVTDVTVEGAAAKKLTVTYGSFTRDITVSSVPPTLESIEINATSYTKKIVIGETYPTAGITATAHYSNGTSAPIATADLTITAPNTATAGTVQLKVAYEGKEASVNVTVLGVTSVVIQSNTVNNGKLIVLVGDTVDLSSVAATVTFSDSSTGTVTAAMGLQVGSVSTASAGTVTLTVTYKGVSATLNITVNEAYSVEGAELSSALKKFTSKSFSNYFSDRTANYKVGDDNPFRFTLTLKTWDNALNAPGTDITDYVSQSKVYLVTGTGEQLLTGNDLATYVTVNEQDNTFDFTDTAVNKTFRIETRPAHGVDESDADTVAAVTKSLTVDVVDGYNVYSAKELNLITNASHANIPDYGQATKTQLQMVEEFLQNNNITRPANMAGVVLHCDLTVTADDIPAGYLYSYTNKAGQPAKGLYDHFSIFYHVYNSASPSFGMYGNYFTVNTAQLPTVCEAPYAGNDINDDSSSSEVFAFDVTDEEIWAKGLNYDHNAYRTRVENIFISSEDPNSNTEQEAAKSKLGLIAFKMYLHTSDFYNVIIEKHTLSICADSDNNTINIDKCYFFNSWNMHIYAWSNNYILDELDLDNSDPSVYAKYQPIVINIKNSTIAKCGGPVIIADPASTTDLRNKNSGAIITAENSTIYSYVQGNEAWFTTYGVSQMASNLIALNEAFAGTASAYGTSAGFAITQQGYEGKFANLIYVNRGKNGSFTVKDTITIDPNGTTAATYVAATGGQAPIFQSGSDATAYFNGIMDGSALPLSSLTGNPDPSLFQGNYLNIYYGGMSIMVQMFH
ncbi:MAG: bacterial Ig-like domain-containing protein [Clostridia bacterium]|nr:bacterial Ig-like domain-containing protein [Clostridia bacterium]